MLRSLPAVLCLICTHLHAPLQRVGKADRPCRHFHERPPTITIRKRIHFETDFAEPHSMDYVWLIYLDPLCSRP